TPRQAQLPDRLPIWTDPVHRARPCALALRIRDPVLTRRFLELVMNRRAFLLITGGVGLLSPQQGRLHEAIAQIGPRRGSGRIARAICRGAVASSASASRQIAQTALPGADIPKYVDPLPVFTGARISAANIDVSLTEFQQQVLPPTICSALPAPFDGGTFCWGYKVGGAPPNFPGFTIEAQRGTPTIVTYNNDLPLV